MYALMSLCECSQRRSEVNPCRVWSVHLLYPIVQFWMLLSGYSTPHPISKWNNDFIFLSSPYWYLRYCSVYALMEYSYHNLFSVDVPEKYFTVFFYLLISWILFVFCILSESFSCFLISVMFYFMLSFFCWLCFNVCLFFPNRQIHLWSLTRF